MSEALQSPQSQTQECVEVSRADLPLHCPPDNAPLWQLHPRVFLSIEQTGQAKCPYCGTEYVLKDGGAGGHGH